MLPKPLANTLEKMPNSQYKDAVIHSFIQEQSAGFQDLSCCDLSWLDDYDIPQLTQFKWRQLFYYCEYGFTDNFVYELCTMFSARTYHVYGTGITPFEAKLDAFRQWKQHEIDYWKEEYERRNRLWTGLE